MMMMAQKYALFILLFSMISLNYCLDRNSFYFGGNFMEVYTDDSSNGVSHASSFLAYSFDSELLEDDLGSVFADNSAVSHFVATSTGVYGSGPFNYADYDYSNHITEYDADDDEWTSLNNGIWCTHDCVDFITGVGSNVFFAGTFSTLESLPGVDVPGLVMMNAETEEFSVLPNPNNVFPSQPDIQGLAGSPLADYLYIYEATSNTVYRWSEANNFEALYNDFGSYTYENGTLTVSSTGDVYLLGYQLNNDQLINSVLYWPASASTTKPVISIVKEVQIDQILCSYPVMTSYLQGVVIAYNQVSNGTCESSFVVIVNGTKQPNNIPLSANQVSLISAGQSDELFIVYEDKNTRHSELYYWNSTYDHWIIISLNDIDIINCVVTSITYYDTKSSLYVYVINYVDDSTSSYELIRIKSQNLEVDLKSPGSLSSPGFVYGIAYDSKNDLLYIGGNFDAVDGKSSHNFAYYSFDDEKWEDMNSKLPIRGLTSIEDVIYVIFSGTYSALDPLPFAAYSYSNSDVQSDVKKSLPFLYYDGGSTFCVSSNSSHVFVGGNFIAQNPDFNLAYGLTIFNVDEMTWSTIPINSSIISTSFEIKTIASFELDSTDYLMFGGQFSFVGYNSDSAESITFKNIALWDDTNRKWVAVPVYATTVNSLVYMYDGVIIIGSAPSVSAASSSVTAYNMSSSSYSPIGTLKTTVNSILLNTQNQGESNQYTTIYAGGYSATGLVVANFSNPDWQDVGTLYENMYTGSVSVLLYSTGGNGQNGQNGSSSSSGGDGWWIALLIIGGILLLVAVVVIVAAAGFVVYKKKLASHYEEL